MTADITLNAGERILWTGAPQHHPQSDEAGINANRRRRAPRPIVLWHVAQPEYVRGVIAQAQR
ncbi:hypothetical protein [Dactylosporangium sp. NPDC000521]|uniref:hypothetical protein n=1 Tax=Dactylosporangium sp. NPDC000521 TaxID=3363975 RepID=UPI00368FAE4B